MIFNDISTPFATLKEKKSAKSVTYHHLWSLVIIYTKIKLN